MGGRLLMESYRILILLRSYLSFWTDKGRAQAPVAKALPCYPNNECILYFVETYRIFPYMAIYCVQAATGHMRGQPRHLQQVRSGSCSWEV